MRKRYSSESWFSRRLVFIERRSTLFISGTFIAITDLLRRSDDLQPYLTKCFTLKNIFDYASPSKIRYNCVDCKLYVFEVRNKTIVRQRDSTNRPAFISSSLVVIGSRYVQLLAKLLKRS